MKRAFYFIVILVALMVGCAIQTEPTAIPVNPTVPPQPQIQTNATLPPPTNKCQSKLSGTVTDAGGKPIKGALVTIKSGSFTAPAPTDDNGRYGFAGLCAGRYTFGVQLPGQQPKAQSTAANLDGANSEKVDLNIK
jgi:hypothetical protein